MGHRACGICTDTRQSQIEKAGLDAESGLRTWASITNEYGHAYNSIKTHLAKHYEAQSAKVLNNVSDELAAQIKEAVEELLETARLAPADVRPLILVAAHNLLGLAETRPSQETIVRAMKTVQEMTGMKQEQRLMLAYGAKAFGQPKAIDADHYEEADIV